MAVQEGLRRQQIVAGIAHGIVEAAVGLRARGFAVVLANDAVVDLSEQLNDAFIATQKLIENDVFRGDSALNRDVVGTRQQLDHMAKDLENMLQYVEHMSYQLGRAPSI